MSRASFADVLFSGPARLYQRFQFFWDRLPPAAGLALMLWLVSQATQAYPSEWRWFLSILLFLLGLWSPDWAYLAFVVSVAYPLYQISLYVATLVLATLILSARWCMQNLGIVVLIMLTPFLLPWHLEGLTPLLAGLWWGETSASLCGGIAALWLKLLAGMSGQPLDLAQLSGWAPAAGTLIERFGPLGSLRTLTTLFDPFADTSRTLLFHLLQILAWAAVAYLVGRLLRRAWSDRWRGLAPLIAALLGAAAFWGSYVALSRLLLASASLYEYALVSLWVGAVAAVLRLFYLALRRPWLVASHPLTQAPSTAPLTPPRRSLQQTPGPWSRPTRPPVTDDDGDVIMLELD